MKETLSKDLLYEHKRIECIIQDMNQSLDIKDIHLSDFHSTLVKLHQISFDLKCISKYFANYE